jgi:hypothetical protein
MKFYTIGYGGRVPAENGPDLVGHFNKRRKSLASSKIPASCASMSSANSAFHRGWEQAEPVSLV